MTFYEISIIPRYLEILDSDCLNGYFVRNVSGLQLCFSARIRRGESYYFITPSYSGHNSLGFGDKIPIELFIGKKEGDKVTLETDKGPLSVILSQKKAITYNNDNFEVVLHKLTSSMDTFYESTVYEPPLSELFKKSIYMVTHERYSRSIGLEINFNNFLDEKQYDTSKIVEI